MIDVLRGRDCRRVDIVFSLLSRSAHIAIYCNAGLLNESHLTALEHTHGICTHVYSARLHAETYLRMHVLTVEACS